MAGPSPSHEPKLTLREVVMLALAVVGLVGHAFVGDAERPTLTEEAKVFTPLRPDWVPEGMKYFGGMDELSDRLVIPLKGAPFTDIATPTRRRLIERPLSLRTLVRYVKMEQERGRSKNVEAYALFLKKILRANPPR